MYWVKICQKISLNKLKQANPSIVKAVNDGILLLLQT